MDIAGISHEFVCHSVACICFNLTFLTKGLVVSWFRFTGNVNHNQSGQRSRHHWSFMILEINIFFSFFQGFFTFLLICIFSCQCSMPNMFQSFGLTSVYCFSRLPLQKYDMMKERITLEFSCLIIKCNQARMFTRPMNWYA